MAANGSHGLQVEVTAGQGEGSVLVAVRGEIDPSTAPQLREQVDAAIQEGQGLSLDLSGVSFMDSSGLAILIKAHQRLRESGRRLVVVDQSRVVRRLLEVTQLSGEFSGD